MAVSFGRKPSVPRQTMSVPEMRQILGLGKTAAYWLIKKNYFETVVVAGSYRVNIKSFEEWYSRQWHYRKVEGPAPGNAYPQYMSVSDVKRELSLSDAQLNWLLYGQKRFRTTVVNNTTCISRRAFERWYAHQLRYRKANGEKPGKALPKTYSGKEVAQMLGIPLRNSVYDLINRKRIKSFVTSGQLRIDAQSFHEWYEGQDYYRMDLPKEEGKEIDDGFDCEEEE